MAWVTFPEREGVAFKNADGKRNFREPSLTDSEPQYATAPGCSGCSQAETHAPCIALGFTGDVEAQRWEHVSENVRLDWEFAAAIQQAAWLLGYIQNGYPHDVIYNYGEAGNVEQSAVYEIVSVSGATLTLKGANPKNLRRDVAILNPDWPATPGRLLYSTESFALPVGAACDFLAPSVYHEKGFSPYVASISYPESDDPVVEFEVVLSARAASCKNPYDEKFPAADGKYYVRLYWNQDTRDSYPNLQPNRGAWFSRRTVMLENQGVVTFSNGENNTRVLYPGMLPGALTVRYTDTVGRIATLSAEQITARLSTVQNAEDDWTSTLDLSDIEGTNFVVTYRPQCASGEDQDLIPFAAHCANAQRDFATSGQPVWFCANPQASKLDSFQPRCWQPECDGFCLGVEGAHGFQISRSPDPPAEVRLAAYWDRLWHRGDWYIEQLVVGESGVRNYRIGRPSGGGPSLEGIIGGFVDSVPTGKYPLRWNYYAPTMGELETIEETDPESENYGRTLSLVFGAFFAQTEQDLTEAIPLEGALSGALGLEPETPPWIGATDIYSYGITVLGLNRRADQYAQQEAYAVAIEPGATEDASVSADIRARFA